MGRLKESIIEDQDSRSEALAELLGITNSELDLLSYEMDSKTSSEGLVYYRTLIFSEDSPQDVLEKINGLYDGRYVDFQDWEIEGEDFYEDFELDEDLTPFSSYKEKIRKIELLLNVEIDDFNLLGVFFQQCYISVFGVIEAYLYEKFLDEYDADKESGARFVSGHPDIKDKKIKFSDIFDEYRDIDKTIKKIAAKTNFHNFPAVKLLYEKSFDVKFPDFSGLLPFISFRHDAVHRSGKDIYGQELVAGKGLVKALIEDCDKFIESVEKSFNYPF